jgi:hypothetical protein
VCLCVCACQGTSGGLKNLAICVISAAPAWDEVPCCMYAFASGRACIL